jgi:hypothetical protein
LPGKIGANTKTPGDFTLQVNLLKEGFMIRQNLQNFKLGTLHKTKVIGSSGLALLMSFAKDIGLDKRLDSLFSHFKERRRGYSISAKVLVFLQMIIKGGDRLNDVDTLRSDPGLLSLLRMESVPRPNTLSDLAYKFGQRDIHRLAEIGMELGVHALVRRKPKRVILDIDSTLIQSDMEMASSTYEGFRGFNPLLGMIRGGGLSLVGFSLFRPGNEAPQEHNLSLVRKNIHYLKAHLTGCAISFRSDAAGYNHHLMRFCDEEQISFVIAGRDSEAIPPLIKSIETWTPLRGSRGKEEVGETLHFIGPEKTGGVYRLVVVRRRNDQEALFPEFEYSYRLYVTNTAWSPSRVVRFYRKRGDAENVIRELKEGYGLDHILAEEFLAASVFFQLQLLAYNLVQVFKAEYLAKSWWTFRIKQLRFRLINIAALVVRHARKTILRLPAHYKHRETFRKAYEKLNVRLAELRL